MLPAPTARLTFRAWREGGADAPLAEALWGDPRVARYVGGPFDAATVRARLEFELANQRAHGIAYWPLVRHGETTPIGCCGLKPYDLARGVLELGFYLVPEAWGQGYAVEAGERVIAHAFEVLGVPWLWACHHPENTASRRALQKLGFAYAHDELYPPTGLMHPGYRRVR